MTCPITPISEMEQTQGGYWFTLWSPDATGVALQLYTTDAGEELPHSLAMRRSTFGRWTLFVPEELAHVGIFYTFRVKDMSGRWLEETPGIFAKAVGVNGKRAAIVDMEKTNPEGWADDVRPALEGGISDAIIYEMHHRDFSIDAESAVRNKGKYLALTEHGTACNGQASGIDHLMELGVTHVQLLPSFDFGSVDESCTDEPQYNWGYDPVNYNVPEGSYSTDPYCPTTRIREFKQMVLALHRAGIRVVMDVVYNHVHDLCSSNFERTAPGYFFRWNDDGSPANGSGCGNETASEHHMMRKFMVESVLYWAREYHVDGFRFDLMGLHDIDTMKEIRQALFHFDSSIIIYGEGWSASSPALPVERLAVKANVAQLSGIAAFGDEMRDGLRGPWNNDRKGGFLVGRRGNEESVKFGIAGATAHDDVEFSRVNYSSVPWSDMPSQMISYVSCHDDLCLADRICATLPKANREERIRLQKLAYAVVLTSRGVPFIWCGDEFMRDRKGVRNCYCSPDSVNAIPWKLKAENREVFDYIRELISFRKEVRFHHQSLVFLPVATGNLVAYVYGSRTMVVLNVNRRSVRVALPDGNWRLVSSSAEPPTLQPSAVIVPRQSAVILMSTLL